MEELLIRLMDAPFSVVEKNVHSIRPANRKEYGSIPPVLRPATL